MKTMKRWALKGAIGLSVMVALWAGFSPGGLAQRPAQADDPLWEETQSLMDQLQAAIREIQQTEPAYRTAQAEVKEAARQIKSFLPVTLEASEPIKQNPTDLVAVLGTKKIPMKENASGLRFELGTFNGEAAKLEPVIPSKKAFMVLRL